MSGIAILFLVAVCIVIAKAVIVWNRGRQQQITQSPRACVTCGTLHPGHAVYCRRCGERLI